MRIAAGMLLLAAAALGPGRPQDTPRTRLGMPLLFTDGFERGADEHAHSLFVVDGAPRVSIARTRTEGTPWKDGWHRVRLVRRGSAVRAFFDDWERPVMTADDRRFPEGRVGLGTFDDTARFDDVRVWGVRAESGR